MTTATIEPRTPRASPVLERRAFDDIPRAEWERLMAATPEATPFARWSFHRAWWDAYADTAEDLHLVLEEVAGRGRDHEKRLRAIVPLMVRADPGPARVAFMGASYHADYATILAARTDLPDAVTALVSSLVADPHGGLSFQLDSLDVRRLRSTDPVLPLLTTALATALAPGQWRVERRLEDVCPVVTLARDWESQLASLPRTARHELRRKLRRADRSGPLRSRVLPLVPASLARFIELHQARWGEAGLFSATADGDRTRVFAHRLVELEAEAGAEAQLRIMEVMVGDHVISAMVVFDDRTTRYYYNAGIDPASRDLSPGVVGTAMLLRDAIEAGKQRLDFLRGSEPYKYEWGAVDEAIERVGVLRRA